MNKARKQRMWARASHWVNQYKKLYQRLSWPLRIPLLLVSVVAGLFALLIVYELFLFALGIAILFGIMLAFAGGGRRRNSGRSSDDAYMQDMFDAEQRRHEDEGRV